jgi:hypothetical protein
MTIGTDRVRVSFNPSGDTIVNEIKLATSRLIDGCDVMRAKGGEKARCAALAMTAYEEAAMWAVKAATTPEPSSGL